MGFIDFIIEPTFKALELLFNVEDNLKLLSENRKRWEELSNASQGVQ